MTINNSILLINKRTNSLYLDKEITPLQLTRTIWVSCLSHFLLLLLHPRQIRNGRCTRTRASACNWNPARWQISGLEIVCIATLRQCSPPTLLPGINSRLRSNLHRDTRNAQPNLCHDGKKCAIPSLHRDSILAKVPGLCPVPASGNTTSPYCRAVSCKAKCDTKVALYNC